MQRLIPAALAMAAVAACSVWPTTPTGGLIVRNPLAGGFHTQVIPDGTERLAVLLAALSDESAKPVSLFALNRSETTRVVRHLPVGPLRAVVAAFDGSGQALAANEARVAIKAGETSRLEVELSTDPELLNGLARDLALMAGATLVRPQPSPSAVQPSASVQPGTQPSQAPVQTGPSAVPSGGLFPLPFPSLLAPGMTAIDDGFEGTTLNALRWVTHIDGTPSPQLNVDNGLHLGLAPGVKPGTSGVAAAEVVTRSATAADVEAFAVLSATSWPKDGQGSQVGLLTQEASLTRTVDAGRDVYVLNAGGNLRTIPAPAAGGRDELRLVKKGTTLSAFAGPVGATQPVGQVTIAGVTTSLTVGVRSFGLPASSQPVRVTVHRVGLRQVTP